MQPLRLHHCWLPNPQPQKVVQARGGRRVAILPHHLLVGFQCHALPIAQGTARAHGIEQFRERLWLRLRYGHRWHIRDPNAQTRPYDGEMTFPAMHAVRGGQLGALRAAARQLVGKVQLRGFTGLLSEMRHPLGIAEAHPATAFQVRQARAKAQDLGEVAQAIAPRHLGPLVAAHVLPDGDDQLGLLQRQHVEERTFEELALRRLGACIELSLRQFRPLFDGRHHGLQQWSSISHRIANIACGRIPFNLHGWNEHSGHTCLSIEHLHDDHTSFLPMCNGFPRQTGSCIHVQEPVLRFLDLQGLWINATELPTSVQQQIIQAASLDHFVDPPGTSALHGGDIERTTPDGVRDLAPATNDRLALLLLLGRAHELVSHFRPSQSPRRSRRVVLTGGPGGSPICRTSPGTNFGSHATGQLGAQFGTDPGTGMFGGRRRGFAEEDVLRLIEHLQSFQGIDSFSLQFLEVLVQFALNTLVLRLLENAPKSGTAIQAHHTDPATRQVGVLLFEISQQGASAFDEMQSHLGIWLQPSNDGGSGISCHGDAQGTAVGAHPVGRSWQHNPCGGHHRLHSREVLVAHARGQMLQVAAAILWWPAIFGVAALHDVLFVRQQNFTNAFLGHVDGCYDISRFQLHQRITHQLGCRPYGQVKIRIFVLLHLFGHDGQQLPTT
mmetsp:Transcript_38102/g.81995  ORF Transcript_38102/g.81995 Transcript_38102/m.81995 type:complete len:667 (-) Transcript_38102:256-2256(-)